MKRGFSFLFHERDRPFAADPERRDQLLVAASPHDAIADTHWYRPDFDHFLVREAQESGAVYCDRVELGHVGWTASGVELEGSRQGVPVRLRARFLVDASGPRGFLHQALSLPETSFPFYPPTSALYTHFSGVSRLDEMELFPSIESAPYPVDDAALHHVFEGGWIWVLRFNNGITSAGVAATNELAAELRLSEGAPAWERLLERLPTVRRQFSEARPVLPFFDAPRLSFRAATVFGRSFALLPSAAAFVDPLLSTGFPLTLLGIERLARSIEEDWNTAGFARRLEADAAKTLFEADTAAALVGALYASFGDFPLFVALSMLYFAAASFAESARRLGRAHLSGSFLSGDHPVFGPELRRLCRTVCEAGERRNLDPPFRERVLDGVLRAIEPLNVAGLFDPSRRNWYPVDADALAHSSHKLGARPEEIERLLTRSGFVRAAVRDGRVDSLCRLD